jgi:hypothetical protein
MQMHMRTLIDPDVIAEVRIEGKPTQTGMRRLIAMLTLYMEILADAPADEAVRARLERARSLLYPETSGEARGAKNEEKGR